MKHLLLLPVFFFCGILSAQELEGSWERVEFNGQEVPDMEVIAIFQDGYFAIGAKRKADDSFHSARGGEFSIIGDQFTEVEDFNTENPELVGKEINSTISWNGDKITISEPGMTTAWQRISNREDDLTGNWVITGRKRNGEINTMTPGDRRTIKILSGGRFQWVAFNSATAQFNGTGGGTYTAEDGTYTENIKFFSRDESRVGATLTFEYEVIDGKWHHQGISSKGDPIYEIWSPYEEAYQK